MSSEQMAELLTTWITLIAYHGQITGLLEEVNTKATELLRASTQDVRNKRVDQHSSANRRRDAAGHSAYFDKLV